MKKIGIVGLGLIGASIAKALCGRYETVGVDIDRDVTDYCAENGMISSHGLGSLRGADIVFVAVPIGAVERTVKQVRLVVGEDAVLADTASVKGCFGDMPTRYVGTHPMAGNEQSGAKAAKAEMFENAFWIITSDKENPDAQAVAQVVLEMGALPVFMSAQEHDKAVAGISHLPHMVAYALANTVLAPKDNYASLASGGFLDTTRIASSSPDFWLSVVKSNKENVLGEMDAFSHYFARLREYIADGNSVRARAFFADGKRRRDNLLGEKRFQSEYALYAFVKDEVGVISRVSSLLADGGVDLKSIRIDNSREGEGGALRLGFRTLKDYSAARGILEENGYL